MSRQLAVCPSRLRHLSDAIDGIRLLVDSERFLRRLRNRDTRQSSNSRACDYVSVARPPPPAPSSQLRPGASIQALTLAVARPRAVAP